MTEKYSFTTCQADASHVDQIVEITNDAFMADAFFKKPAYRLRFDKQNVVDMMKIPDSMFIVAIMGDSGEICGSIYFDWKSTTLDDGSLKVCSKRRKLPS